MSDVTVPDEYDDWPFDAKRFVLAEANYATDLRTEIEDIVGLENKDPDADSATQFTKEEMAAVLMALGGPKAADGGEP